MGCAVFIRSGRLFSLPSRSRLSGGSGSRLQLRRREPPSSAGPFKLTGLLHSVTRGPASPVPTSPGTTTTTRTTGINIRSIGADPKSAKAIAVAPMSNELAASTGSPLRALEQQQRKHEQPPPPSKLWCLFLPGRGYAFVNEQILNERCNAHSLSLHWTPVSSATGPFIRYC